MQKQKQNNRIVDCRYVHAYIVLHTYIVYCTYVPRLLVVAARSSSQQLVANTSISMYFQLLAFQLHTSTILLCTCIANTTTTTTNFQQLLDSVDAIDYHRIITHQHQIIDHNRSFILYISLIYHLPPVPDHLRLAIGNAYHAFNQS